MTSVNEELSVSGESSTLKENSECNPESVDEFDSSQKTVEETEDLSKELDKLRVITNSDDFIDEEELKEKEESYSEEDKVRLKAEAEAYKNEGNKNFKQSEFKESINNYTLGLRTCPLAYQKERAILYANRGAAKVKLGFELAAIDDCTKAIELDPKYVRALLRRAQLYENSEKLDEALEDFKKVLEMDPSNRDAVVACSRLPPLINERNEKMKEEMFGKLKDLGNLLLKPFGLSSDNFKMVQDPNTGGYSINFQQNT